jgi:hypothetical protein
MDKKKEDVFCIFIKRSGRYRIILIILNDSTKTFVDLQVNYEHATLQTSMSNSQAGNLNEFTVFNCKSAQLQFMISATK